MHFRHFYLILLGLTCRILSLVFFRLKMHHATVVKKRRQI